MFLSETQISESSEQNHFFPVTSHFVIVGVGGPFIFQGNMI